MSELSPPRLVAVAGSLRKTSFNRWLLRYAIDGADAEGNLESGQHIADLRALGAAVAAAVRAGIGQL